MAKKSNKNKAVTIENTVPLVSNWERIFLASWHPYAWICAIGAILYFQILFFDFVYFDEGLLIIDRYYSLSQWSSLISAFTQEVFLSLGSYYRPLLTISFVIDAKLGGAVPSPFMYHLTNIILHIIASCVLYLFLTRLNYRKGLSLFFTLLFTVHPVLTQAVAWIPGRNDSLLAVFMLVSFIVFMEFIGTKQWKYYFWHMFFFTLSIFTKELAFIIVPMALLYLHLVIKEKLFSYNKLILCAGWLILIMIWILARSAALNTPSKFGTGDVINSMIRDLPAIFIFLGKTLFPFNLSVLPILEDSTYIFGILTLALLILAAVLSKSKRSGYVIFGALWFLFFLIPSFITSNLSVVSFFVEHRIYISLIGIIIILLEIDFIKNITSKNSALMSIGIIILILFTALTFIHSRKFQNKQMFWSSAVESSPHSPLAHINLGYVYYTAGDLEKAEAACKRAIELKDDQAFAHLNLGLIYMDKEMFGQAEQEFTKELALNKASNKALFNLGILHHKEGMHYLGRNELQKAAEAFNKAEADWRENLRLNPNEPLVHNQLGLLYMDKKMYAEAETEFRKELAFNPGSTRTVFNLGLLYYDMNKLNEAEDLWLKVLKINPREQMVYNNLGFLYVKKNMLPEAERAFRSEIAVNPTSHTALFNLGLLYSKQGRFQEAEQCWKRVIEVKPDKIDAYRELIILYQKQKEYDKAKFYIDTLQKMGVKVPPEILKNMESK